MFEYEDEEGQQAIVLSKVSFVTKTTNKDYFIVEVKDDLISVPLEQYTKFMNMLKAWAMKH